jgi:hypothetical protein
MVDLSDSKGLLDRAQKHGADLQTLLHRNGGLWQLNQRFDRGSNEWTCSAVLDRSRLRGAKWILADAANNVASALDHIAAAISKARGNERNRRLYFPWGLTDETFETALKRYEPMLGSKMSAVIADARTKHRHELGHVEAIKEVSNSGKHWELFATTGSARAVAMNIPGGQRIFQIPQDAFNEADEYVFYRGAEELPPVPLTIVIGVEVAGLPEGLPKWPDSMLSSSFRFVAGMVEAVEHAGSPD